MPMTTDDAERAAVRIGLITTAIGSVLTFAPARVGPKIGLTDLRATRVVGLTDLALAPGLLRGRPRWPWLSARAGLNFVIVGYALTTARHSRRSQIVAAGLVVATVSDLRAVLALRRADR
jgi:hypothetical protein